MIREITTILLLIGGVMLFWQYNATRPTDEAGTQAVLESRDQLVKMAEKYPYKPLQE